MNDYPALQRYGEGKALLEQMRASGAPVPELVRVRELVIDFGTSTRNKDEALLRTTFEFSDGQFRAMNYRLTDITYSMLRTERSIVTQSWIEGSVPANPPRRQAETAPAESGVTQQHLMKMAELTAGRIVEGETRIAGALNEHARVVRSLRARIAELEAKLEQK